MQMGAKGYSSVMSCPPWISTACVFSLLSVTRDVRDERFLEPSSATKLGKEKNIMTRITSLLIFATLPWFLAACGDRTVALACAMEMASDSGTMELCIEISCSGDQEACDAVAEGSCESIAERASDSGTPTTASPVASCPGSNCHTEEYTPSTGEYTVTTDYYGTNTLGAAVCEVMAESSE